MHNLKGVDVEIPHSKFVVVTGLSGSGKSTLAFDTIFAEGQRRYVESLSAYARQFLGRVEKPDVDLIEGVAPAIAIEQKVISRNPRSTVGTTTEIYDYLKLLFARVGRTYSPITGLEIRCYEVDDVVDHIMLKVEGTHLVIAAPLLLKHSEGIIERMLTLMGDGVNRVRYKGEVMLLEQFMPLVTDDMLLEDIMIVVDRVIVRHDADTISRLSDSVLYTSLVIRWRVSRRTTMRMASTMSVPPSTSSRSIIRLVLALFVRAMARLRALTRTW